ncbi:recombinase family protein [Vibrio viridaestus]|uniref:Recombinase family protein n=1 Tax=Vibrio viridaestus TaxID=2487322 RepID=A0A3N9TCV3_9VIBR|nr:recombinase family protein [Vibrio viridaestus]RQW62017.1 recombinase family protein [Vibrio viridaestus]
MSNAYAYLRMSPKIEDVDRRIEALKQSSDDIELFVEKGIKGRVPLDERPEYEKLNAKLVAGDELFLWWIDELGIDFLTSVNNVTSLIQRGVTIRTINQNLEFKLDDQITDALIKMMHGYAESDRHKRMFAAEMGRRALKCDPGKWKEKFRGRRGNEEMHRTVAQKLFEGKTLQQVADETEVSLSTVKRIKAKLKEHDEMGQMRGRGHHREHRKHGHINGERSGMRHGKRHGRSQESEDL